MYNTQMLKGILDWCVLSIIKDGKIYSQEIVTKLRQGGFADITDGTLFPLMLRLEKEGLVDSERVDNPFGASRKYYSLNATGEQALAQFTQQWACFKTAVDKILKID